MPILMANPAWGGLKPLEVGYVMVPSDPPDPQKTTAAFGPRLFEDSWVTKMAFESLGVESESKEVEREPHSFSEVDL